MSASVSFLFKEIIVCGAVLSGFELCEALRKQGINANICTKYRNPELENYFKITPIEKPKGLTVTFTPQLEGDWAYVRTKDKRWLKHEEPMIAVSEWIAEFVNTDIIIGNGTHERFKNLNLERDIAVLIEGNYESNKNIDETIKEAKKKGGKVVWFGRTVKRMEGCEAVPSPNLDEVVKLYNRARCFLKFSKEEGWGRPIAEARACGVPEVINLSGGNQEIEVVPWSEIAKKVIETLCLKEQT